MPVRVLSTVDKAYIADAFTSKAHTISELVVLYNTSRRTVIRVLEEQGIDPGIRRRTRKSKTSTAQGALPLVIKTKTPWYQRVAESVGRITASLANLCA